MSEAVPGKAVPSRAGFVRHGRTFQLRIEDPDDLHLVLALDEALWVATGAPLDQLQADPVLVRYLDHNQSGRVLTGELKAAIRWTLDVLTSLEGLGAGSDTVVLAHVNADHRDGARIHRSAGRMLESLGAADRTRISLQQIREVKARVSAQPVSEAGVVVPAAARDPEVSRFIAAIVEVTGGVQHPGGDQGIDEKTLETFLQEGRTYLEWRARAEQPGTRDEIMPMGDRTPAAYQALLAVRDKVEQYFALCDALTAVPGLETQVREAQDLLQAVDLSDLESLQDLLARAPLAVPTSTRTLELHAVTNPRFQEPVTAFFEQVVGPVLETSAARLPAEGWRRILKLFSPHQAWVEARPADRVARLGMDRLTRFLEPDLEKAVRALIAESRETALALEDIRLAEKLALFQANLMAIANNFVSFPSLYDPERRALFEQGTLVMDGRRFNLAVKVGDLKAHARMARTSEIFVLYVEVRPGTPEAFKLAIPVTAGGKGNLCRGKRGVFQHVDGREYDAVVVDLIENPVSILEAMAAPFRKIGALITGKIESMTTEATKELEKETQEVVSEVEQTATRAVSSGATGKEAGASGLREGGGQGSAAGVAGMAAGWGVAIAALGSSLAYVTKTLSSLSFLTIVGGIAGAVLAVILPASLVTAIRLRRRDLSAILEGSGWAINARMRLTWSQSRAFTRTSGPGAVRLLVWRIAVWVVVVGAIAALGLLARHSMDTPQVPPSPVPSPVLQGAGGDGLGLLTPAREGDRAGPRTLVRKRAVVRGASSRALVSSGARSASRGKG